MPNGDELVGRTVFYWPGHEDAIDRIENRPLSMRIAAVCEDGRVNGCVLDRGGRPHSREGVVLRRDGEAPPDAAKSYCEAMPGDDRPPVSPPAPETETEVEAAEDADPPKKGRKGQRH